MSTTIEIRLLPLLAGGGWEGVQPRRKAQPLPNPPLLAGEGAKAEAASSRSRA
jgi:hypothetical protein